MPAQSTLTPIATVSPTTAPNPVTFNNIPQTYTDLMLVVYGRTTHAATLDQTLMYINFNTGTTNYSNTLLYGTGSGAFSSRNTNGVYFAFGNMPGANATANIFGSEIFHFLNYSSTVGFKTVLCRTNADLNGSGEVYLTVNTWRQTTAISRIDIYGGTGGWATGSMLTLYGITAA